MSVSKTVVELVCFHVNHHHSWLYLKAIWWLVMDKTSVMPLTH